ncbi:MAG: hypothetical protein U1F54_15570 [Burkholderiales bacterium]
MTLRLAAAVLALVVAGIAGHAIYTAKGHCRDGQPHDVYELRDEAVPR